MITKREIEKVAKKIDKARWQKVGQWKTPFLMDYIILEATKLERFRSRSFLCWFRNFYIMDGEFIFSKDVEVLREYFKKNYNKKGYKFLEKYSKDIFKVSEQTLEWAATLPTHSKARRLTKKELKKIFSSFVKRMSYSIMAWGYIIFGIDKFLSHHIYQRLKDFVRQRKIKMSADELLATLTPSKKIAFMIKEREDLLHIAAFIARDRRFKRSFNVNTAKELVKNLNKKIGKKLANKIRKHKDLYAWMNSINWNTPPYNLEYYIERIKEFINNNPARKLVELKEERKQRRKEIKSLIEGLGLLSDLIFEIDLIRDFIDAKMLNWNVVSISGYKMRPIIEEIASRYNLNYDDILSCTPQEINDLISKDLVPSKHLLKGRRSRRALIRLGETIYCFIGNEVETLKKFLAKKYESIDRLLRGNVGFPGKARGRVNVILNVDFINKMKKNNILVCPMTDPDYMPAISKAIAIVTDEGGILCHAAIVSRELKIPCIIGTKIATKVLKDGQLVEVDANQGIVRIIRE